MYRLTTFLTTTLALFGIITMANAQFPESFETAVPPTGWASFRGTNDLGTNYDWTTSTIANSGSQAAYVRYENVTGGLAEDWLVTPQFTPGASSNLLTFMQRQSYTSNYGSVYTVRVSTASQTTHADFTIINTQTEADFTTVYSMKEIDLSSYEGTPIYVAFVMENDDGDNWLIDDVELSEIPACPAPDQLSAVADAIDAATLSWNETGTATQWQVDYGVSGYTPPINSTVTSDNPFNITGLAENTTYDFYVRAICGPGDTSEWTGPGTFTTLAAPIIPDYLNAFSVVNGDAGPSFFPGELWSEASGTFVDGPSGTSSSWTNDDWLNTAGDTAAKVNLYFSGSNHWLISPDFDLSAGNYFLNLDAGVTAWNGTGTSAMGSDDQVDLLLSPDAGVSWTSLYTWNASNTPSNLGTALPTIDLSPFTGVVRFAILASDGTVNDTEDYDFFIDNFSIAGPACSDVSVTDTQVACESFTWSDGNTYTPNNYNTCTSISAQTPGLFTNGPNATWTNVYTACVLGDGNNGAPQTLEINVCSLPAGGANYRVVKTVANGNFFNGAAQPLTLGLNTINVAGVTFDRTVKFQFSDGAVEFDALSLNGNSVYSSIPTQLLTTVDGCDSLVTLDLTFVNNAVSVTDVVTACDSYTWSDGITYDASNYISCTSIASETPGLFATGPNATWTNVYTACVLGDGNNGAAQTLEINVCSLPAGGANYRVVKTVANGNFFNGPAQPLSVGLNTINVAGVTFDRTVKFQFGSDAVEFDALSLNGNAVYSGAPQQLLTTSTGCDSLVTLDLTFISSSSATDVISACDSYTWIDGTEYTASNNTATFVIPNAAGCDSTITLDLTILSSSTSEDIQTTCDTFTWIDGNTYTESNNTATFTVPNAAGCDSTITLNLTVNTVNSGVTVVDDLTLQSDETTAGAEYQWLDCADNFAPIAGETSSTFTTQISGEYAVQVTLNGCTEISDCFIITNTLGFDELGNGFNVDLFPNPTLGSVTFNIQGVKQLDMELYDLQGKLLMHQNGIWDQDQISLEALVPGSYIIKLRSEYGNREIRIVKQ